MQEGLGIQFEFTGPGTPQRNGRIERKFATLYGRVRSALNSANIPMQMRYLLWAECAGTMTLIENCIVTPLKRKPAYEVFWKKGK